MRAELEKMAQVRVLWFLECPQGVGADVQRDFEANRVERVV